jgi:hypothetical protein
MDFRNLPGIGHGVTLAAAHPAMIRRPSLRDPIRRGIALVVATSFHLFVLILMVWPAIHERGTTPVEDGHLRAIQIRFFRPPPPPSAHEAAFAPPVIASAAHVRATSAAQPLKPPTVQYATPAPAPSAPITGNKGTPSDGGFQQQLLKAQHSYAVHGIPGSDKPFVPGIRLIDSRTQGVGAAMRQAQRLFGVTSRHCMDVDVRRNLTPRELIARHVSPSDVDQTDEKYHCNQPLGLSF